MNDSTLKDRPMANADVRPDVEKDAPRSTAKTEFSLTSGAKRVGLSRNVLRDACLGGELPHRKNAKDHYVIEHDQLLQWKKNRDADAERDRLQTVFTPEADVRPDVAKDASETTSFATSGRVDETVSRRSGDDEGLTVKVLLLEQENRSLKTRLQETQAAHDDFKSFAEKSIQALLTDQREVDLSTTKITEQGGHFWGRYAAAFLALALVGSALYYRENLVHQWAKFTDSSDSTAAAVESQKPQG